MSRVQAEESSADKSLRCVSRSRRPDPSYADTLIGLRIRASLCGTASADPRSNMSADRGVPSRRGRNKSGRANRSEPRAHRSKRGGATEWVYGIHPVREAMRAGRRRMVRLWIRDGARRPDHDALLTLAEQAGVLHPAKLEGAPEYCTWFWRGGADRGGMSSAAGRVRWSTQSCTWFRRGR